MHAGCQLITVKDFIIMSRGSYMIFKIPNIYIYIWKNLKHVFLLTGLEDQASFICKAWEVQ